MTLATKVWWSHGNHEKRILWFNSSDSFNSSSSPFNIQLFLLLKSLNFQASLTGRPSSATFFCRIIIQTAVRFRSSISSTPMSWYWNDMKISSHAHAINTKHKQIQLVPYHSTEISLRAWKMATLKATSMLLISSKTQTSPTFKLLSWANAFQPRQNSALAPVWDFLNLTRMDQFPSSETQRMISLFVFLRYFLAKLDDIF